MNFTEQAQGKILMTDLCEAHRDWLIPGAEWPVDIRMAVEEIAENNTGRASNRSIASGAHSSSGDRP